MSAGGLLLAGVLRPAAAQTPPPPPVTQTVILTGTASPVPMELASRSVSVLLREDIDAIGVASIADAFRLVSTIDVRARGPRDVQTDFSVRGSTFGQNLVLLDGLRLNNSQSGHHNGEIPIAPGAIERIEVAHGDPFDRLLLAQCEVETLRLLTADKVLARLPVALRYE